MEGSLLNPSSLHLSPCGRLVTSGRLLGTDQYFPEVMTHHVDMVPTLEKCCSVKMQHIESDRDVQKLDLVEIKLSVGII